jgi:hypothetical protein
MGSREFFAASVGREFRAVLTFQLFNALTWRSHSCLNLVGRAILCPPPAIDNRRARSDVPYHWLQVSDCGEQCADI